jgi:hypothetical protein
VEAAGFTARLCTDIDRHGCLTLKANKSSLGNVPNFGFLSEASIVRKNIKDYPGRAMLRDAGLRREEVALVCGGRPANPSRSLGGARGWATPGGRSSGNT